MICIGPKCSFKYPISADVTHHTLNSSCTETDPSDLSLTCWRCRKFHG